MKALLIVLGAAAWLNGCTTDAVLTTRGALSWRCDYLEDTNGGPSVYVCREFNSWNQQIGKCYYRNGGAMSCIR